LKRVILVCLFNGALLTAPLVRSVSVRMFGNDVQLWKEAIVYYFKVRIQHLRRRIRPFLKSLYIHAGCGDECLCFGMPWAIEEIRSKVVYGTWAWYTRNSLCMAGLDGSPTSRCSCVHCCYYCCCSREHGVTTYRSTHQGCPNVTVVTLTSTTPAHTKRAAPVLPLCKETWLEQICCTNILEYSHLGFV
jgi:hypothetical protein